MQIGDGVKCLFPKLRKLVLEEGDLVKGKERKGTDTVRNQEVLWESKLSWPRGLSSDYQQDRTRFICFIPSK